MGTIFRPCSTATPTFPLFYSIEVTHPTGGVTKLATLATGLEIRVPPVHQEGDASQFAATREFAGRV